jgi:NAD(P) transhydrogenase subunit beta
MTRRARLVALSGSAAGLAVVLGGFARYLSAASPASTERIELYAAVFTGALVFATSAIAFCKMRGALASTTAAHPGHRIVNVSALLLCGWLGYGFVTEQAQPFGLAALLAMSVLAAALGTHLMISREFAADRHSSPHAFAGHCQCLAVEQRGLLDRIEWHGGDEPAWTLRDMTPDSVRATAHRHGGHHPGNTRAQNRAPIRRRAHHRAGYRQR